MVNGVSVSFHFHESSRNDVTELKKFDFGSKIKNPSSTIVYGQLAVEVLAMFTTYAPIVKEKAQMLIHPSPSEFDSYLSSPIGFDLV
jgi:hypothetical protein